MDMTAEAAARALPLSIPPLLLQSQPPDLPRRPGEQNADTIALLVDPLLELCPSLHSIQSLCLLPVNSLPSQDESFRTKRLEKAILRAASNGDEELLSWICYIQSRRKNGDACLEAVALEGIEWAELRDDEGSGPLNLAASSGHATIVQLLVQHGVDVDERDACEYWGKKVAPSCLQS